MWTSRWRASGLLRRVHRQAPLDALLSTNGPGRLAVATSVRAKEQDAPRARPAGGEEKPLLLVDIDGVISLFGFSDPFPLAPVRASSGGDPAPDSAQCARPEGSFHAIDGIPHFLSAAAARHLLALVSSFELVWASGWEEKANEYLPHLLGLPPALPFLRFERGGAAMNAMGGVAAGSSTRAHWKLDAIDAYAGTERPLAWIDDAFNDACRAWAAARAAPTLLVTTVPQTGLIQAQATLLAEWARSTAVTAWPRR
jgi:hypothetical protein